MTTTSTTASMTTAGPLTALDSVNPAAAPRFLQNHPTLLKYNFIDEGRYWGDTLFGYDFASLGRAGGSDLPLRLANMMSRAVERIAKRLGGHTRRTANIGLRPDGVFCIRVIMDNGTVVVPDDDDYAGPVWDDYCERAFVLSFIMPVARIKPARKGGYMSRLLTFPTYPAGHLYAGILRTAANCYETGKEYPDLLFLPWPEEEPTLAAWKQFREHRGWSWSEAEYKRDFNRAQRVVAGTDTFDWRTAGGGWAAREGKDDLGGWSLTEPDK